MTAAKTTRRLQRAFRKTADTLQYLKEGGGNHLFADAETKAALTADYQRELDRITEALLRADPRFEELPDGRWKIRASNVVPLRRPLD